MTGPVIDLPARPVIGVLHPGAMGAAIGSALKPAAGVVIWAAAGRSDATAKRAELADLVGVPDVAELARRSDVIISICPPHAAREVAGEVAAALDGKPARPLYVDLNAVAPATVTAIGELLGAEHVVDGAVIGPPAWEPGQATLWLSGAAAPAVAALFDGSPFAARVLDDGHGDGLGAASGLKACFALQSKALPSIWLAIDAAARHYGVERELAEQLAATDVDLAAVVAATRRRAGAKAWRWAGEMEEAAAAMAAIGLPDGFSRAAAQVYERLAAEQ
jgi:3-hydroxyisobutyrate dehydrogenase-like beta-hydroxyacid dehydrogenase